MRRLDKRTDGLLSNGRSRRDSGGREADGVKLDEDEVAQAAVAAIPGGVRRKCALMQPATLLPPQSPRFRGA